MMDIETQFRAYRVLQISAATPGEFAWFWWNEDEGKAYSAPVVAWGLCEVTFIEEETGRPDPDDDEAPDREVLPLVKTDGSAELRVGQEACVEFVGSVGLFRVADATEERLRARWAEVKEWRERKAAIQKGEAIG